MTTELLFGSNNVISQPGNQAGIPVANSGEPQRLRTIADLINNPPDKPWYDAAERLTRWTEERLVNRTDVYCSYSAMCHRSSGYRICSTQPWRERERVAGALSSDLIARHYRDSEHNELIGVHAISAENTCKWFLIDIDEHGHAWHSVNEAACKRAADAWCEQLQRMGFRPIMLDPNGAGGCQLLVCLSEAVPAGKVHAFVSRFVRNYADYGLTRLPNVCPNEPDVNTYRPYGSWWRLPGLHHTRDHLTRVWNGQKWVDRQEAIETILSVQGDSPNLIPSCLDLSGGCSVRQHAGGFVQLAEFLLREGFDPQIVEDLAVRWDAAQFNPPRNEEHLRQIIRDLVEDELKP